MDELNVEDDRLGRPQQERACPQCSVAGRDHWCEARNPRAKRGCGAAHQQAASAGGRTTKRVPQFTTSGVVIGEKRGPKSLDRLLATPRTRRVVMHDEPAPESLFLDETPKQNERDHHAR